MPTAPCQIALRNLKPDTLLPLGPEESLVSAASKTEAELSTQAPET